MLNRREFLFSTCATLARRVGIVAPGRAAFGPAADSAPRSSMGIVEYSFTGSPHRSSALDFLEYCRSLGAGGVQMDLDSLPDAAVEQLRRRAEELEMALEVDLELPQKGNVGAFEQAVARAARAGAAGLRSACLGGRRYETFKRLDEWKQFVEESRTRIRKAIPVLEKYRIPLGLENHKDWTAEELAGLMKEFASDVLGVCLDTGNNLALLDDPNELVATLAPYVVTTHFKDMAVEECAEGFLLSEVPLGEGFLDLERIVKTIRKARPKARFNLEMITRDPLLIPCLTDRYWATFPERNGVYLARTLSLVRAHKAARPLPKVGGLDAGARAALEEANVKVCLRYAREKLGLT